jgi:pimeloyl-ACP methyl ester carboxylesterase
LLVPERLIDVRGVQLCVEAYGDPDQPAILMIMGIGASMLWWEDGFCRPLADAGRFVIRYDHRDTGRSVSYPPGSPGYDAGDLVADPVGVLDALGIRAAHLVGASMGGALAQLVTLDVPDRVRSLTVISTTAAVPISRSGDLPGPAPEFVRFLERARPDYTDPDALVDYLVSYSEMLSGGRRPFPEREVRELIRADVRRARNPASSQNHELLADAPRARPGLGTIAVPTLVVHGDGDPMFPLEHGQTLAEEIPGARLLVLPDAGHGVERADWTTLTAAILEHTAR